MNRQEALQLIGHLDEAICSIYHLMTLKTKIAKEGLNGDKEYNEAVDHYNDCFVKIADKYESLKIEKYANRNKQ